MERAEAWRVLGERFRALRNEEVNRDPGNRGDSWLLVYCPDFEDAVSQSSDWTLGRGVDKGFKGRFELEATKAGIALGFSEALTPRDVWLRQVLHDLRESDDDLLFVNAIIKQICEASARSCTRLERLALEEEARLKASQSTRKPTTWEEIEPFLSRRLTNDLLDIGNRHGKEMHSEVLAITARGNSGTLYPLELAVKQMDEYAEQIYKTCLEGLEIRGLAQEPLLLRAVYQRAILPALTARFGAISSAIESAANALGQSANIGAYQGELVRSLLRVKSKWDNKIEIAAQECGFPRRTEVVLRGVEGAHSAVGVPESVPDSVQPKELTPVGRGIARRGNARLKTYLSYRSPLKRQILRLLSQYPEEKNIGMAVRLDEDGIEMPKSWRGKCATRSFEEEYKRGGKITASLDSAISKVRRDMRHREMLG